MDLNQVQFNTLTVYSTWRNIPPTFGHLIMSHLPRFATLAFLCGITSLGAYLMGYPQGGLVMLGVWIGVLLGDTGRIRVTLANWPMLSRTLDWDRVETALSEHRIE